MHPTEGQLDSALCKKAGKRKLQINKHLKGSGVPFDKKETSFP